MTFSMKYGVSVKIKENNREKVGERPLYALFKQIPSLKMAT